MHQVTVTLSNIERAARDEIKGLQYVHLTFRSEDGSLQWWTVPDWPDIRPGMTVTAFLTKPMTPNRSNRVLGWKDHETGELAGAPPLRKMVFDLTLILISWSAGGLLLHQSSWAPESSRLFGLVTGWCFLAIGTFGLIQTARTVLLRARLKRL